MANGHQAVTGKKARKDFPFTKNGKKSKPKAASKNKKGGK
jgi:hypothetical protein